MDRPNDPPNHLIVQRLMRMAGCLSWLTEPLEEIAQANQWFTDMVDPVVRTGLRPNQVRVPPFLQ